MNIHCRLVLEVYKHFYDFLGKNLENIFIGLEVDQIEDEMRQWKDVISEIGHNIFWLKDIDYG